MKKVSARLLAAVLSIVLLFTAVIPCSAFAETLVWDTLWNQEYENGVILFPGSNNSEMNVSWYHSEETTPEVRVSLSLSFASYETFTGYCVEAPDGDYVNKVTLTGLVAGKTYYYQCVSGDFTSNVYVFTTDANENEFSALYMTDIHISHDDKNPDSIYETANSVNSLVSEAVIKNDISLVLSAGDQASEGMETEYKGFASITAFKSIPVATTIGNHDRKGVAYKTFTNMPNEYDATVSSYVGNNYWFTKGDTLFMVVDSNNASGIDHRAFMKDAVDANPDVKWKVMMAHHDLYSGTIPRRESENELLRMIWGPLADEFGVDLFLLGHSHYYSVTNALYDGETVMPYASEMVNPGGTVYMVSGSLTRPRNDEDLGLNEEWIGYANTPDEQQIYNVIDFTENSITVSSYYGGNDEAFNSFTITKTGEPAEKPAFNPFAFFDAFVRFCGTVYAWFNNMGVYGDLKDKGYDVNFFEVVF